jgi:hypothetical protein
MPGKLEATGHSTTSRVEEDQNRSEQRGDGSKYDSRQVAGESVLAMVLLAGRGLRSARGVDWGWEIKVN